MSIDRSKLRWNGWGWAAHQETVSGHEAVWAWLASEVRMPSLLATPPRPLEDITLPRSRLGAAQRAALTEIAGQASVRDDKYERAFHARGRSYHDLLCLRSGDLSAAPDAVIYPRSTEEVQRVVSFASDACIAIVPYGGGTSVVGGVTAAHGSFDALLTVDLSAMNRIEGVDREAMTACAEAGIYGPALENGLASAQLVLGHYPQSFEFSTLGGWIAHRGAGQFSTGYGRPEDWLISAELATPRGLLHDHDFPASAAGPRLADLVIGSEGAFGIVTRATIRLRRAPETTRTCAYVFPDFISGTNGIRAAMQDQIPLAMLRLSDSNETRFQRTYSRIGRLPGLRDRIGEAFFRWRNADGRACALIAQFEGSRQIVRFAEQQFRAIAKDFGAVSLGRGPGERWRESRFHAPYLRDPMLNRGLGVDTLETATKWSNLATLYSAVKKALENSIQAAVPRPGARGIVMCHVSHSYPDGASLYFTYIFPRVLNGEIEQWQTIKQAASEAVMANGGTISHHHGVGEDHLPWIAEEKSALGIDILRAVKRTLDPKGILNPGKLIPP